MKPVKMPKSVLKKSKEASVCSDRRVTFCKTIKIYGNSAIPESLSEKSEDQIEEFDCADVSGILSGSQFIISHKKKDFVDGKLSEDPDDFFVHKVVYDEETKLAPVDDAEECDKKDIEHEDIVYYPTDTDSDITDFVVHKAVLSENELVCNEIFKLETITESVTIVDKEEVKQSEEKGNVYELSIENIEQHNKLTESKILADCDGDSQSTCPTVIISEITLSPPLKELNVKQLICPESDNWFWNLDISPLNSVQETDSESNLSSEDTMIMMTSEECEKNEQRIQESLQKFQSLKKQKILEKVEEPAKLPSKSEANCELDPPDINNDCTCSEPQAFVENITSLLSQLHVSTAPIEDPMFYDQSYDETELETNNISLFPLQGTDVKKKAQEDTPLLKLSDSFSLSPRRDSLRSPDSSLLSVEIPRDVREWKIMLDKSVTLMKEDPKKSMNSQNSSSEITVAERCNGVGSLPNDSKDASSPSNIPNLRNDELENFVDQCSDRVERIKKRYSVSEKLWTPRRGIRPRFGSTAEILQQIQKDSCSPMYSNPHYSWPSYNTSLETSPIGAESSGNILNQNTLTNIPLNSFQHDTCFTSLESSTSSSRTDNLDTTYQRKFEISTDEQLVSRKTALLTFHERGVPEGASPPRLSTESLSECNCTHESLTDLITDNSMIYYSMKV